MNNKYKEKQFNELDEEIQPEEWMSKNINIMNEEEKIKYEEFL